MTPKLARLPKLSFADAVLGMLVVILGAVAFVTWKSNVNAEQDKANLDLRRRAVESRLSDADRRATLESLRQRLEQVRSAPADGLSFTKADAVAATDKILSYAQSDSVSISGWVTSYISTAGAQKQFSAIKHHLVVEAETDGLLGFVEALTEISTATAVQNVGISRVKEEKTGWQMDLELLIYYR